MATDTSIVIPSETLQPNRTYNAQLLFGKFFYSSTNAVPEMSGYGFRIRTTRFTVKTGTGGTPGSRLFFREPGCWPAAKRPST